jgi:hypothetical protein
MDPKLRLILALIGGLVDQAGQIGELIDLLTGEVSDADLATLKASADDANGELDALIDRLRGDAAHHSPAPGS